LAACGNSPPVGQARPAGDATEDVPRIPAGAVLLGPTPVKQALHVEIALRPRDPSAVTDFVASISNPKSSKFRHYLKPGQFESKFGPPVAQVQDMTTNLERAGFTVAHQSPTSLLVSAVGTVGTVEQEWHVQLMDYRLRNGRIAYANTNDPTVPSGSTDTEEAVLGLDDLTTPGPSFVTVDSAPAAPSCTNAPGFDAPYLATAYDFNALYGMGDLGSNETIGLIESTAYDKSAIATFESCYGIHTTVQPVVVASGGGSTAGATEAIDDIEVASELAPDSRILVYEGNATNSDCPTTPSLAATTCFNEFLNSLLDALAFAIGSDAANVLSTSLWYCGLTQSVRDELNQLLQQAASQGQSVLAASGDEGKDACYKAEPVEPAEQPYVTAVGGTQLLSASPLNEVGWSGSGGGVSENFQMPSWQKPLATDPVVTETGCQTCVARAVPDVAAAASVTAGTPAYGFLLYNYSDCLLTSQPCWNLGNGGTSLAAPLWAALVALSDQECGTSIGFLNPSLYSVYADDSNQSPSPFNQVTSGNNGYPAGPGYNLVTGLGTPNAGTLAQDLCNIGTSSGAAITGLTPTSGPSSGGTTVTVTGSGFTAFNNLGAGESQVTAVLFGTVPATHVVVQSNTSLTAVAPAHVSGAVDVRIETSGGLSIVTPSDQFTYTGSASTCSPSVLWQALQAQVPSSDSYPNYLGTPPSQTPTSLNAHCAAGWAELGGFPINAGSGFGKALFQQTSTGWKFVAFDMETGVGAGVNTCAQYPPAAVQALGSYLCATSTGSSSITSAGKWSAPTSILEDAAVSCASSDFCMAFGPSASAPVTSPEIVWTLYNGSTWSGLAPLAQNSVGANKAISCPTATFCAATSFGAVYLYNGSTWTSSQLPISYTSDISCSGPDFCMVLGTYGGSYAFNGAAWSPVPTPGDAALASVSCVSDDFCAAINGASVFIYNGQLWSAPTQLGVATTLNQSQLPAANLVTNITCATADYCVVAAGSGVFTFNGATWSSFEPVVNNTEGFSWVSCSSPTFCAGIVNNSDADFGVTYDGSNWTSPRQISSAMAPGNVSCAGPTFCMAIIPGQITDSAIVYTGGG
jgi:hypothetical protein